METTKEGELKKLIFLLFVIAAIGAIAKAIESQKKEWAGLTESEARAKLDRRIGDRMPADKKAEITDKVVSKMKQHGGLKEEAAS